MTFFELLFETINAPSPTLKLNGIAKLRDMSKSIFQSDPHRIFESSQSKIHSLTRPSYAHFCHITHPTKIRRPKHIQSEQSLAKVLHSIVHIEYSAIDLALDALYRFRNLPFGFYQDWLEVAFEESLHFSLLLDSMQHLGFDYGDFPVHSNLFDAQCASENLKDRMALLHRGMEANGLDANPFVTQKIKLYDHPLCDEILKSLDIILNDEISHVKKGDYWWRFSSQNTTPQDFIAILKRFSAFHPIPRILNHQARLQAGFSQSELELLESSSML
uniref:DUF455 domain-containing protein n=1 Tax=uncultured Helicobacter sp. TaxID=175537 RepID=A0A650ELU7_9HELI|nr:hypothetical protein Helico4rc_0630 [uncultured Helicobacter sp.]